MNEFISRKALLDAKPKNDELSSLDVRKVICSVPAADVEGILINYHGPFMVLLGELGLYLIKPQDIELMEPIPMPKELCDNYRNVIETYLKECENAAR